MTILAWIVLGLVAGAMARALMPGRDPGGIIVTMLIGIVGAFLGGFLGNVDYRVRAERLFALEHHPGCRRRDAATSDLSAHRREHAPRSDARRAETPSAFRRRSGVRVVRGTVAALALLGPAGLLAGSLAKFLVPGRDPVRLHCHGRPRHPRRVYRRPDRKRLRVGSRFRR